MGPRKIENKLTRNVGDSHFDETFNDEKNAPENRLHKFSPAQVYFSIFHES